MGLNIKNPATEAKIRALAARTGESLTDAVDTAVQEKLEQLEAQQKTVPQEPLMKRLRPLLDMVAAQRKMRGDARTSRELMDDLYDEHGLPK
jgi:antitoxin VapB